MCANSAVPSAAQTSPIRPISPVNRVSPKREIPRLWTSKAYRQVQALRLTAAHGLATQGAPTAPPPGAALHCQWPSSRSCTRSRRSGVSQRLRQVAADRRRQRLDRQASHRRLSCSPLPGRPGACPALSALPEPARGAAELLDDNRGQRVCSRLPPSQSPKDGPSAVVRAP
jgi:hypothetical protein